MIKYKCITWNILIEISVLVIMFQICGMGGMGGMGGMIEMLITLYFSMLKEGVSKTSKTGQRRLYF